MFADCIRYRFLSVAAVVVSASLFGGAPSASAQVLFNEDFEDETLAANAAIANGTIANGILSLDDPVGARGTFSVVQEFTDPVMTFSFDVVAPVTEAAGGMELLLRAGIGTAQSTLQNADQMVEAIMYRGPAADPTRGAYMNNGNESIFLVANNKATDLTFTSPVDNITQVTLTGFQYIPYVKDNLTQAFGEIKGVSNYTAALMPNWGTFTRFGIGSSSTGHVGTFAIDNVLVASGVTFEQEVGPPPVLGDTDGDMVVELSDFDPIRANFRKIVSARTDGDLVRNGTVDFADFREWKAAFLGAGGSLEGVDLGFIAGVPEPSTIWLVLMAGCGLLRRVRL